MYNCNRSIKTSTPNSKEYLLSSAISNILVVFLSGGRRERVGLAWMSKDLAACRVGRSAVVLLQRVGLEEEGGKEEGREKERENKKDKGEKGMGRKQRRGKTIVNWEWVDQTLMWLGARAQGAQLLCLLSLCQPQRSLGKRVVALYFIIQIFGDKNQLAHACRVWWREHK